MDSVIIPEGFRNCNAIFLTTGKNIIRKGILLNDRTTQTGKESGRFHGGTAEPQKGEKMALGVVQAGYKSSLYTYAAENSPDWDCSFEEWLVELTTGLELAMEGSPEDNLLDADGGAGDTPEDGQTEAYSARKKEWEEILEQANVVEDMLRQMMENGLGQQKEEEKTPQKQEEEGQDNEFTLEGVPVPAEGKSKGSAKSEETSAGNSAFLQSNAGGNTEYLNLANGGRKAALQRMRTVCLTCETDCDRKKQWKITTK